MAPPVGVKFSQEELASRMLKRMQFAFAKQFPRCEVKLDQTKQPNGFAYLEIEKVVSFLILPGGHSKIYALDDDGVGQFQFDNAPKDGDRDRRMKSHDRMWRLFMASEIGQEKIKKWNALPTQTKVRKIPTGLPALDKALENGLSSGTMTTFAAVRPVELNTKVIVTVALAERISKEPSVQGLSLDEAVNKLLNQQLDSLQ